MNITQAILPVAGLGTRFLPWTKVVPKELLPLGSKHIIHDRTKKAGLNTFEQAIKNVAPLLQLKSRRVGGANYQVPVPVSAERRQVLAMRWLRDACRNKKGKRMAEKLADELLDASNKTGAAMKKREETHRMAEANKAFAHFA
jgi:small subunit ribosomal protein S7